MRAVVMNGTGGREMLEYVERPDPVAGPGEALVEIAFAGVNFMDIGVRQGMAWTEIPNPKILGVEGAGRVLAVGDGVEGIAPGQRVAWVYAPGSYARADRDPGHVAGADSRHDRRPHGRLGDDARA